MSVIHTPRTPETDHRRILWANVAVDDVNLRHIDPERCEELRALAILANDRVRMRNESEECVGDVDLWATYLRSTEDINEIVSFRPETGLAYIRTRGCWEGYILAANVAIKPAFGRG